jgi:outer membrane receptor protein involved in Fe transport
LLKPENAKSYTVGIVLTPTRNLSGTFDYYQIKVDDVISNAPPVTILNQCLATGNPIFCNAIHRAPGTGALWLNGGFITATNANLGKWKTSGIDVAVNYQYPLQQGWGGLGVNFVGTWLKEFIREDIPGTGEYDCAGLYGNTCSLPAPEWRHKLRFTWNTPWNVDATITWRHFDSVLVDTTSSNPLLSGAVIATDRELKAQDYMDIAASWSITKQLTLRGGINNVFDKTRRSRGRSARRVTATPTRRPTTRSDAVSS